MHKLIPYKKLCAVLLSIAIAGVAQGSLQQIRVNAASEDGLPTIPTGGGQNSEVQSPGINDPVIDSDTPAPTGPGSERSSFSNAQTLSLSDFDWYFDNVTFDAFEQVYYYEKHALANDLTDHATLEGSWNAVIWYDPEKKTNYQGKELGTITITPNVEGKLDIKFYNQQSIPDTPGAVNPISVESLYIIGFWNPSDIINANIQGGGSLDFYSFFELSGETHAVGMVDIMTKSRDIYRAYIAMNR